VGPIRGRLARLAHGLLGPDPKSARQGFYALLISSGGDLLAGMTLGTIQHTLEQLPGLLVLIPAAIGMRGNIFGALGSRLGTAIHTGTFTLSRRRSTVVGQNLLSSLTLTFVVSLALAALAKSIAVAFDLHSISLLDFVVISMVGGVISSAVVLAITVGVAAGSARYGWDMDHFKKYATSATEENGWENYVSEFIAPGEEAYLEKVGGAERVSRLKPPVF